MSIEYREEGCNPTFTVRSSWFHSESLDEIEAVEEVMIEVSAHYLATIPLNKAFDLTCRAIQEKLISQKEAVHMMTKRSWLIAMEGLPDPDRLEEIGDEKSGRNLMAVTAEVGQEGVDNQANSDNIANAMR